MKNLQFNPTHEHNNSISFLDLLITRHSNKLEIDIRIPETYNNRHYHKLPLQPPKRTQTCGLPLLYQQNDITTTNRRKMTVRMENNKIYSQEQQLPNQTHNKTKNKIAKQNTQTNTTDNNKKWAIFTYHSPNIRKITNLFKHTNINIAFRSANTLFQRLKPRNHTMTHDYNSSGIYKLTCMTCSKSYIGQTSWNLTQRYREHIRYIRNNNPPICLCTTHPLKYP
jgi:hypothetical protein